MTPLQSALIVLESALTDGRNLDAEIDEVRGELSALLHALSELPFDPVILNAAEGAEPLAEVLERLRTQLHEGDGEAEELWRRNKERLSALYNPRQVAAIDYAMRQWNFAEALDILSRFEQGNGGQS